MAHNSERFPEAMASSAPLSHYGYLPSLDLYETFTHHLSEYAGKGLGYGPEKAGPLPLCDIKLNVGLFAVFVPVKKVRGESLGNFL